MRVPPAVTSCALIPAFLNWTDLDNVWSRFVEWDIGLLTT